jgi:prepilin-type processing-associated H-X9-DG protein
MPDVYRPVRGQAPDGYTFYQGFVGEEAMFPARNKDGILWTVNGVWCMRMRCRDIHQIRDGTSYTLLVVEAGEAIPWTKPDDLAYDPAEPLPTLGGMFDGDFNVCFCDGSVHRIPKTAPENLIRALITPAGGERVDLSDIGLPDPRRKTSRP